jgi:hypothetical protein
MGCETGFSKKSLFYNVPVCARKKFQECKDFGYGQCTAQNIGCAIDAYSCTTELLQANYNKVDSMLNILKYSLPVLTMAADNVRRIVVAGYEVLHSGFVYIGLAMRKYR